MTSTKKRTHAKPPANLRGLELERWRELLTQMGALERGVEELSRKRSRYCVKEDFDRVAQSNRRLAEAAEAKLIELEALSASRPTKEKA